MTLAAAPAGGVYSLGEDENDESSTYWRPINLQAYENEEGKKVWRYVYGVKGPAGPGTMRDQEILDLGDPLLGLFGR